MRGRQHPGSFFRSLFLHIEELQRPGAFIKLTRITAVGPNVAILVVLELQHENRCQDSLWVFDWTSGWSRLVRPPFVVLLWTPISQRILASRTAIHQQHRFHRRIPPSYQLLGSEGRAFPPSGCSRPSPEVPPSLLRPSSSFERHLL